MSTPLDNGDARERSEAERNDARSATALNRHVSFRYGLFWILTPPTVAKIFHMCYTGRMSRQLAFSVTLRDCRVDTFRSGGPGGQNQNKRDTGVRVTHPPSGAVGESRQHRSQLQNKKAAFVRMAQSRQFTQWAQRKVSGTEAYIHEAMRPENLLIEEI